MTRFLHHTLTHGLNTGVNVLCGVQYKRRLETLQRDAIVPVGPQTSLFAAGPGRKQLFH